MVSLENIQRSFGNVQILNGASITIHPRDRVGLIGSNGSGKTTLLSILAGELEPDRGAVHIGKQVRTSYIPQNPAIDEKATVFEEVILAFADLEKTEAELPQLEKNRAEAVLLGLGFEQNTFSKKMVQLSGAERGRVALARILLEEGDLLLLDEPTNHLDLAAMQWLEGFLSRWNRALLVVSHDRYFLDRVIRQVSHLTRGRLKDYKGNYTAFASARAEERATAPKQARLQSRTPRFSFSAGGRSGDLVLEAKGLTMERGARTLFQDLSIEVRRCERLGIVGPNGCGKSTLLKILGGALKPKAGSVRLGAKVIPGTVEQDHGDLEPQNTVLKLALLDHNLLFLDEPTNHLDLSTREVLEDALIEFEGTLIIVSHDRYFLERVTNRTLVLEDGDAQFFSMSYPEVLRSLEEKRAIKEREEKNRKRAEDRARSELAPLNAEWEERIDEEST